MAMSEEAAEALAAEALAWLAADADLLGVFMGATGLSAEALRTEADRPETLAAVLDFLLMDDLWVTSFCDAAEHPYTRPAEARARLPGGVAMHWT